RPTLGKRGRIAAAVVKTRLIEIIEPADGLLAGRGVQCAFGAGASRRGEDLAAKAAHVRDRLLEGVRGREAELDRAELRFSTRLRQPTCGGQEVVERPALGGFGHTGPLGQNAVPA